MMTRPDIAHSVAYLARFNANPGPAHWNALKHLFRYLKGTSDHKLTYHGDLAGSEPFITYSDASHGDCIDTGRSTAGFVTMMDGGDGTASCKPLLRSLPLKRNTWLQLRLGRRLHR